MRKKGLFKLVTLKNLRYTNIVRLSLKAAAEEERQDQTEGGEEEDVVEAVEEEPEADGCVGGADGQVDAPHQQGGEGEDGVCQHQHQAEEHQAGVRRPLRRRPSFKGN